MMPMRFGYRHAMFYTSKLSWPETHVFLDYLHEGKWKYDEDDDDRMTWAVFLERGRVRRELKQGQWSGHYD